MGEKRTVTAQIDEKEVRRMEKVKEETGLSFSAQINLAMRGYEIVRRPEPDDRTRPRASSRPARTDVDPANA